MHPMRGASVRQRFAFKSSLRSMDAYAFFDLLTDTAMLDEVDSLLPDHRERLLPPTETLSMFLAQALDSDRSCQFAVDAFVSRRVALGLSRSSTATGAYCKARQRLPEAMVVVLAAIYGQAHEHGRIDTLGMARPARPPGGRHDRADARYARQPGRLSAAVFASAGTGISTVPAGDTDLFVQRCGAGCGSVPLPGQGA